METLSLSSPLCGCRRRLPLELASTGRNGRLIEAASISERSEAAALNAGNADAIVFGSAYRVLKPSDHQGFVSHVRLRPVCPAISGPAPAKARPKPRGSSKPQKIDGRRHYRKEVPIFYVLWTDCQWKARYWLYHVVITRRLDCGGDLPGHRNFAVGAAWRAVLNDKAPECTEALLFRSGPGALEVHPSHSTHAAAARHRGAFPLRRLRDHRLGGNEQAGD